MPTQDFEHQTCLLQSCVQSKRAQPGAVPTSLFTVAETADAVDGESGNGRAWAGGVRSIFSERHNQVTDGT